MLFGINRKGWNRQLWGHEWQDLLVSTGRQLVTNLLLIMVSVRFEPPVQMFVCVCGILSIEQNLDNGFNWKIKLRLFCYLQDDSNNCNKYVFGECLHFLAISVADDNFSRLQFSVGVSVSQHAFLFLSEFLATNYMISVASFLGYFFT